MSISPQQLVRDNLRFAFWIANRVGRARGADREDFAQASVVGLCTAAEDYDPARGAFTTFAAWRCRAAVQAEVRRLRGPTAGVLERERGEPRPISLHMQVEEHDEAADRWERVQRALAQLADDERVIFLRHFRDGETTYVLARENACTHQAVSQRLRRIMTKVREAVK